MSCEPTNAQPFTVTDPCAMLPQLRGALMQLMTGQARAEVRLGDQTLRYHPGNIKELRNEINRLEHMCNADGTVNNSGRAVQMQYRPQAGYGHGRYR